MLKKKSLAEVLRQAEAPREHDGGGEERIGGEKEELEERVKNIKGEEALRRRSELEIASGHARSVSAETWQVCLVRALVEMPPDVAEKVIQSLPREVLVQTLEASDDPFVKLALKLLALSK